MKINHISKLFLVSIIFVMGLSFFANADPPAGNWTLAWSDEFDGASLDTSLWGYGEKPWGTTDNSPALITPEDTYLSSWPGSADGVLVNRARMGDFGSYNFTTGWAWSKIWMTYGYMEIRAQFPDGQGQWPAWWMLMDGWPPEFDVAEYRGAGYLTQAFYWGSWDSNNIPDTGGSFTGWHTYGFEWGPGYLKWYMDGLLTFTHTSSNVPSGDMYVILSAGLDSSANASTGFPNYFVVDYFRWYQQDLSGPPSAPTSLAATPGSGGINLSWNESPEWDVQYYNVYSSTTQGGPYSLIATGITGTSYGDTGLTDCTTYYYVVTAVDIVAEESIYSNEASATAITLYPVTVENDSFELPGTVKQSNWTNVPGWSSDVTAGDSGVESGGTVGSWRGYLMGSDPAVWQITSEIIAADNTYVAEVDLWDTAGATTMTVSIFYVDNSGGKIELALSEYAVAGLSSATAVNGTVSYTVPSGSAAIGKSLGIMINNNTGGWAGMDNVRLSYGGCSTGPDTTPPAVPTGLTATAGDSSVSLDWADNSEPDLSVYGVYRSTVTGGPYTYLTDTATSDYVDNTVTNGTTYYYVVTAVDTSSNESANSNEVSATPDVGVPVDHYANGETTISGTVGGSYADTTASDNVYEAIAEVESGGKPSNRHSLLEHTWTINIGTGGSPVFYVEAYHNANSEGDDFVFAYSSDNVNFTNVITVTQTSDDNVAQGAALPSGLTDTIYIRVTDTDSTQGNRSLDTIYVDQLYIRTSSGGGTNTPPSFTSNPIVEINAVDGQSYSSTISDDATDPDFDPLTFSKISGPAWLVVALNGDLSGTPATGDVGLNSFTVEVNDGNGGTDQATLQITVDPAGAQPDIYVFDIAMSSGSSGGNRYRGIATITIRDDGGAVVSDATVSVDWTGATSESMSDVTDANGQVVFESSKVKNGGTYIVTVTDVAKSGTNYNPALNIETSDSITAP